MEGNALTKAVSWDIAVSWPHDWIVGGYWFGWCNNVLNFVLKHIQMIETCQKVHSFFVAVPAGRQNHFCGMRVFSLKWLTQSLVHSDLSSWSTLRKQCSLEKNKKQKKINKKNTTCNPHGAEYQDRPARKPTKKTFFRAKKPHLFRVSFRRLLGPSHHWRRGGGCDPWAMRKTVTTQFAFESVCKI